MTQVEEAIRGAFSKAGLDPELGVAIAMHEGRGKLDPRAEALTGGDLERGGAYGAMQMTMQTARGLGFTGTAEELKDPYKNAELAAQFVSQLSKRFGGNTRDVIAAYNSGKPYARAGDVTRDEYVPGVLGYFNTATRPSTRPPGLDQEWVDVTPPAPGNEWVDVTPKPDSVVASDGARTTQDKAVQAIADARDSGFSPEHTIADPTTETNKRLVASFDTAIKDTPGLWAYASQSYVHASAVAADAEQWSAAEKFISGKLEKLPTPIGGPYAGAMRGMEFGAVAPPVWVSGMLQGAEGAWGATKALFQTLFGPGLPFAMQKDLKESIQKTREELARPIRGVGGPVSEAAVQVAKIGPQLAALALASEVGGTPAMFAAMWGQSVGNLKLAGVEDAAALTGGFVSASLGTWFGAGLIQSLTPRAMAEKAAQTAVQAALGVIKDPTVLRTGVDIGRHFMAGFAMQTSMAISDSLTTQLSTKGFVSASQTFDDASRAAKDSLYLLPYMAFGPVRDYLIEHGRWAEAHASALQTGGYLGVINSTGLMDKSPAEVREVLKSMGSRPVYLDTRILDSAARTLRMEPSALVDLMTGKTGALEAAQNTGAKVQVPSDSLVVLRDVPGVAENSSLHPDGSTVKEVGGAPPEPLPIVKTLPGGITLTYDAEGRVTATDKQGLTAGFLDTNRVIPGENVVFPLNERRGEGAIKPTQVRVNPQYQRRGIATAMYEMLEEATGERITPSSVQTDEGRAFSNAYEARRSERPSGAPLPGGEGTKPEMRRFAEDAVSKMTIGEIGANRQIYVRLGDQAQRNLEVLQQQAVEKLAKAGEQAQAGVSTGVQATEEARGAARMNMKFAQTARLREWLKGLVLPEGAKPPPEPTSAETGLYNIPEINAEVAPTEAQKWYSLGEAQRKQAIMLYKASLRTQQRAEDQSVKSTAKTVEAGEAYQQAAAHERTRDLNRAMEAARAKAEKEATRIENFVDKLSSDDVFESTSKAGIQYGTIQNTILASLGKRVIDSRSPNFNMQAGFQALIAGGDEISFDRNQLLDLERRPREFSDLRPDEAANVEEALRTVRTLALQASRDYMRGERMERSDIIKEQDAALAKGSEGGQYKFGKPEGFLQKVKEWRKQRAAEKANEEGLWFPYGDYGAGVLHDADYSRKLESDLQGQFLPKLEIPKELRKLGEQSAPLPNIPTPLRGGNNRLAFLPDTVKLRDLWRAARMAGTVSGMEKLSAGYGVPEMEIERWLKDSIKTKAEWDFIDSGWGTNEQLYGLESVVHAQRAGLLPEKLGPRPWVVTHEDGTTSHYKGGYDPFRWQPGGGRAPEPVSAQDPYAGNRRELDTPHGFTKDRIDSYYSVPDISWDALRGHYNAVLHDIAWSNFVRDKYRMINDPEFRHMTLNRMGKPWLDALDNWVKVTAVGRIVDDNSGASFARSAFREIKGLAATSVFNANLPVILGQLGHLPIVSAGLGIEPWHMAAGLAKAITPEGWTQAGMDPVVGFRSDGFARKLNFMWQQSLGYEPHPWLEGLARAGQEAQHGMDTLLSRTIWHASMIKSAAEGIPDEQARLDASRMVSRGMPAMTVGQQSSLTRDKIFGFIMMVKNFENAIYNQRAMMDWETRTGIAEGENAPWARAKQIGRTAGMMGGLAFGLYLMGHGKKDDESWGQFAGRSAITEYTYGNPFMHLAAQAFSPILVGESLHNIDMFGTPAGQLMSRLQTDIGHLVQRSRPMDKKMWDALDLAARTTGLPVPPAMLRSAKGVYGLARYNLLGRNDFYRTPRGPGDQASIAFYGERRTGTPLSDAQKIYNYMIGGR